MQNHTNYGQKTKTIRTQFSPIRTPSPYKSITDRLRHVDLNSIEIASKVEQKVHATQPNHSPILSEDKLSLCRFSLILKCKNATLRNREMNSTIQGGLTKDYCYWPVDNLKHAAQLFFPLSRDVAAVWSIGIKLLC